MTPDKDKLLLFDFDGVIADSFSVFFREYTSALTEMGYDKFNSEEALLRLFDGNVIAQLIKNGFPVWKLKKLGNKFKPRIDSALEEIQPFENMPELVNRLAIKYPLYIITSNQSQTVGMFLDKYNVKGMKDILGSDKESSKTKKIKTVKADYPEVDVFYIGDTKGDMIEGRSAGVQTVAVTWGWHAKARLESASPDYTVDTPAALANLLDPVPENT